MGERGEAIFTCNLCEALCGMRVATEEGRPVAVRGDPEDVLSRGHICPKAHGMLELYDDPDRLRAPVVRGEGGEHVRTSWDDALELASSRLREIRKEHGNDSIALYVGNPVVHSHRSSFAAQLLTLAFSTHNRFDPNSQDSNPRLFACMQVYGDALAMPVPDIERTDFFLMLGANPAASNGSMMGLGSPRARFDALRARGGRVVLFDPRRTESVAWSTEHHFIRPGGDAALLLGMLHVLFEEGLVRKDALAKSTQGIEELAAIAKRFSPERVAPATGVPAGVIRDTAIAFAGAKRACCYARVGVCQNEFGPVASWLVEVLNVVTDRLDREGGVVFPTPAADIAPLGRKLIGNHWGRWRSRVRGLPEFLGALPSAVMAEEMETPGHGKIRALVCIAGNPVLSTPNGARLERAIEKLDFFLAIDLYLNETTRHAHVVLPPKHVFETGNYDILLSRFAVRNVAKYSAPFARSGDDTRDDWEIATEIALGLLGPAWGPAKMAARALSRKLPELSLDTLLRTGPYRLRLRDLIDAPHGLDLGPLEPKGGGVRTPDQKVRLAPPVLAADIPRLDRWVDASRNGELVLIGRRHMRSNNSWLHNLRSLTKGPDRSKLMMHPADAAKGGLKDGARVRVKTRVGEVTAILAITADVSEGVVSLPHGFGHASAAATLHVAGALAGPNANVLTDEAFVEPVIGTSILNGVPVIVEALNG